MNVLESPYSETKANWSFIFNIVLISHLSVALGIQLQ